MTDTVLRQSGEDPLSSRLKETDEIEKKVLTLQGRSDFIKLINALGECGAVLGTFWEKDLFSSYFDTARHTLYGAGIALRIRHEFNKAARKAKNIDLSTKDLGKRFGSAIKRTELEAVINRTELDINKLYAAYEDNPEALDFLDRLCSLIANDPHALREIFTIKCRRINLKTALYIAQDDDGNKWVGTKNALNGHAANAKRAVFEFSLDHSKFAIYGDSPKDKLIIGEDYEIEFELKMKNCPYDPQPSCSSENLDPEDVILAQEYLAELILNCLSEDNLDWTGHSKQERGFAYLLAFEKSNGLLALADKPTHFGKPIVARNLKPRPIHQAEIVEDLPNITPN